MKVKQAIALAAEAVEAKRADKRLGKRKENEKPEASSQREKATKIASNYKLGSPWMVGRVDGQKTRSSKT